MGDECKGIEIDGVFVQENGIIRNKQGLIIGRLSEVLEKAERIAKIAELVKLVEEWQEAQKHWRSDKAEVAWHREDNARKNLLTFDLSGLKRGE